MNQFTLRVKFTREQKLALMPKPSLSQSHRVRSRCAHEGSDYTHFCHCSPSSQLISVGRPAAPQLLSPSTEPSGLVEPRRCLTIGSSVENPLLWQQQRRDGPHLRGTEVIHTSLPNCNTYTYVSKKLWLWKTIGCHPGNWYVVLTWISTSKGIFVHFKGDQINTDAIPYSVH